MSIIIFPLYAFERAQGVLDVRSVLRGLWGNVNESNGFSIHNFDIDLGTGCFPPQPLPKLPETYSQWEAALAHAPQVLALGDNHSEEALANRPDGERWRQDIPNWPVLDTAILVTDTRYLQKAHMVLAFLLHFYVHSIPQTNGKARPTRVHIPKSIAMPLVAVSKELGTEPLLTFADTVLWNWDLTDAERPLSVAHMRYVNLLSGTDAERAFYQSSAAIELKGAAILEIIEGYMNLPNVTQSTSIATISNYLVQLTIVIEDLTSIFGSIRESLDPSDFYWMTRPWWNGAEVEGTGGSQWLYEGVPRCAKFDLGGPSAGQSTIIHALDIFLGVDHRLARKRFPAPSESNRRADTGFMDRMRRYMPGKHRHFLERLDGARHPLRDVAEQTPGLRGPYNTVVTALKQLRTLHLKLVCLYVVTKARATPPPTRGLVANKDEGADGCPVHGVGGTSASILLKAGRDATNRAILRD